MDEWSERFKDDWIDTRGKEVGGYGVVGWENGERQRRESERFP